MTVQCPRCETQYRLAESRLSDPRPVFKCTRCNHVFAADERPASGRSAPPRDGGSLPLPFARQRSRALTDDEDDEDTAPVVRGGSRRKSAAIAATDDVDDVADVDADEGDDEEEDESTEDGHDVEDDEEDEGEARPARGRTRDPAFVSDLGRKGASKGHAPLGGRRRATAPPRPAPLEDDVDDDTDDAAEDGDGPLLTRQRDEGRAIDPRRQRTPRRRNDRSPMRAVLLGVGTVVAAFATLAGVLRQRPELVLGRLAGVPVLGHLVGGNRLRLIRLQLTGLESAPDRIKGDRRALVVSGQVHNGTGESLRLVEIEGRLFAGGVESRRLLVYAANQPRKTIHDLSAEEIGMLLRLKPSRGFEVRPGSTVGFLLVFIDPPENANEVRCRIVDALPPEASALSDA